ncbi:hypothetical protein CLOM_g3685 [Closterium sp. NIES-68]|nr:hypothetical protein CLOM_g3685 [Closterium sp. NIES-68]
MAAAGSSVSQLQQCTKIISVLDNSWDNLIPTLNSQQGQWTPEWLRQQILQEDFRRRHKFVKDRSLKGLEVKGGGKEIGSCPTCLETKFSKGKPNVMQAGSVVEQIEEDEIAHCYWAPIPEPKTREEALNGPNGEKWKASEDEEFGSLIENETWDLCDLPPGKKAITSKMIYRHKYGPEGELTRYNWKRPRGWSAM